MTIENRGPELAAIAIFFVTLCHIFVFMRLYARAVIMKSLGADDWLALGSLVSRSLKKSDHLNPYLTDISGCLHSLHHIRFARSTLRYRSPPNRHISRKHPQSHESKLSPDPKSPFGETPQV